MAKTAGPFFISRAGEDKDVALVVDQILRDAGYEAFIQDRDFGPTAFTERMDHGMKMVETGAVIVALVSGTYLNKDYCMAEALYPLRRDPFNKQRRLVVLRIADCEPEGLLGPIPSVDLVPHLHDAAAVKRLVLGAVDPGRFPKEADFAALQRRAARQTIHPEVRPLAGLAARPDEMAAIDAALWKGDGGRAALTNSVGATAAVKGLGGVGKSVLARGYAWENRARYHGVWWLRAQSPDTILDDLIELGCRIVNPGLREWPDRRAAAQAVLDAIAQQKTDKPWLLVYDNAEAPEGVRDLIPPAGAHALLTTRWQDWYGEATEVRVGVFPRETATEYLMARARGAAEQPVETRAAAARLAEDLGFLPLALALARADAWGRNWTFAQYRTHISEMLRREPTKAVDYPNSVYATFTAALDRAAASAPEAETLMGLCAFLAPDNIPLDLVDAQEMAEIAKGDAVAALAEVSLATLGRFPDGAPSLDVHRLVQRVMKERLGAGAAEVAGRAAAMVARGYPGGEIGPDDVRSWPMCARLEEHAKAVLETAPETGETAASTSLLLNQVALHWNARAGYAAAEPLMRRALAIDEASYPGSCIRHEELVGDRGVVC